MFRPLQLGSSSLAPARQTMGAAEDAREAKRREKLKEKKQRQKQHKQAFR